MGDGLAKKLEPFVCGGSAATFASCVIHPIDLAKVIILFQATFYKLDVFM